MNYAALRKLIEKYESDQRTKLAIKLPGRVPNELLCNGQVQFASVENATPDSGDEHDAPIVVGIGVNYAQNWTRCRPHTPYIPNSPTGQPGVEDKSPHMRAVLDLTFDAYQKDPQSWVDRFLASNPSLLIPLLPRPRDYFLVATNFSPFITFKEWQRYKYYPADRAQVLAALDGQMQHLDDLLTILGKDVLWVGHGLGSEAFALFRLWQQRNSVGHWLLTANLNGRSRSIFGLAFRTIRFWQRDRPMIPPIDRSDILKFPVDE